MQVSSQSRESAVRSQDSAVGIVVKMSVLRRSVVIRWRAIPGHMSGRCCGSRSIVKKIVDVHCIVGVRGVLRLRSASASLRSG